MKKILGIFGLLVVIGLVTTYLNPQFLTAYNLQNIIRLSSLFAILGIGVAFVIITGGIDLSIGSLAGLTGILLPLLLNKYGYSMAAAVGVTLLVGLAAGLIHALLITKLRLQPFIVTLCGLLIYRGLARVITGDQVQGFGDGYPELKRLTSLSGLKIPIPFMNYVSKGNFGVYEWNFRAGELARDAAGNPIPLPFVEWLSVPMPFIIMAVIAIIAAVFLNRTIWGRYLLALGRNEQAARYSGINTNRLVIVSYMICSLMAAVGGMLFAIDGNSVQPSGHGNAYELYAIAAAVLGGCSLRGGEGAILGVVIGAAVMQLLKNSIGLLGIPAQLEYTIVGMVILGGVIVDELVKRYAARRRAIKQAETS